MSYNFSDRLALVTGASRGIGFQIALELARRGVRVICVARSQSGLESLDDAIRDIGGKDCILAVVDLSDIVAVGSLISSIRERFGCLDILVGNAGLLGGLMPVSQISGGILEKVFSVNFLANQLLIAGFEDYLRKNNDGRALFLTSGIVGNARGFWGCYGASKAALENLVLSWSAEVTGIYVNLFDPGRVRTNMRAEAFPGEDVNTLHDAHDIAVHLVDCLSKNETGTIFKFA